MMSGAGENVKATAELGLRERSYMGDSERGLQVLLDCLPGDGLAAGESPQERAQILSVRRGGVSD